VAADVKADLVAQIGAELIRTAAPWGRAAQLDHRCPGSIGWAVIRELRNERRLAAAAQALLCRERPNDPQPFFWQRDVRLASGLLAWAHAAGRPVTATELLAAAHDQAALAYYVDAYGMPRSRMLLHDAPTADPSDFPRVMCGVVNTLDPGEAARPADRVDFEELLSTAVAANVTIVLATRDVAQLPASACGTACWQTARRSSRCRGCGGREPPGVSGQLGRRPEVEVGTHRHDASVLGHSIRRRHVSVRVLGTREIADRPFGERSAIVHSRPLSVKPFVVDPDRTAS